MFKRGKYEKGKERQAEKIKGKDVQREKRKNIINNG